jgi:hypothetical protein
LRSPSEFTNFVIIIFYAILHAIGNSFHFFEIFIGHFLVLGIRVEGTHPSVALKASGCRVHGQVKADWIAVPPIDTMGGMTLALLDAFATDAGDFGSFSRRDLSRRTAQAVSHFHELGNIRGSKGGGIAEGRAIAQPGILISQITFFSFGPLRINRLDWNAFGDNWRWNLGETGRRRIKERVFCGSNT